MITLSIPQMARDLHTRVGLSLEEVAEITGLPATQMSEVVDRPDTSPYREWTSGCRLIVAMYLEEGFPLRIIAEVLNRDEYGLWRMCEEEGIPVPQAQLRWGVYTRVRPVMIRGFRRKGEAEQYRRKLYPPSQFQVVAL